MTILIVGRDRGGHTPRFFRMAILLCVKVDEVCVFLCFFVLFVFFFCFFVFFFLYFFFCLDN